MRLKTTGKLLIILLLLLTVGVFTAAKPSNKPPRSKLTGYLKLSSFSPASSLLQTARYSKPQNKKVLVGKDRIMRTCSGHAPGNVHHHATLTILFNDEPYQIPAGIGIRDTCIHPMHTHDTDGVVHIDYKESFPFTLQDFFNTWGILFTKEQFMYAKVYDGYAIFMLVNGQVNQRFENYILKDKDVITIKITSANEY